MSRLATGGLIDRSRTLDFSFDGKPYAGFAGDTLASALVANDVRLVGRSFKYHRKRGILTAGSEEPNALVTLRSGAHAEPNTRATMIELFDGLEANSQNRWPSLGFDLLAVNQLVAPILVAGFYYKTFMWPAALWEKLYEPIIRRSAGLGALSLLPDPDRYDREHAFYDLLVIGGGPAGLAAALTAGRAGLRVILADEDARPGGQLLGTRDAVNGITGADWAAQVVRELAGMPNVRLLGRTTVFGIFDSCEYGAVERISDHLPAVPDGQPRQRLWKIVAKRAVLAAGAIERPLVFGGNDRPGVMSASAVSTYINRFAALPGKKALVFTTSDSGWGTAADLIDAGAEVTVVDPREAVPAAEALRARCEVHLGAHVTGTIGSPLRKVEIALASGEKRRIAVDLLAMAGGWSPAIGLASNLGDRPQWSDALNCFLIAQAPQGLVAAGAAAGRFTLAEALADGAEQAARAAEDLGHARPALPDLAAEGESSGAGAFWYCEHPRGKAFVDFQNDVTDKDIALAAQEGFTSIEHLKRYTTMGMATDQGKTSQMAGHALLAAATGKAIAEVGTVLSRPPYHPIAIGAFAGHHRGKDFRPTRYSSSHEWARANGADFTDAGQWKRPRWYARAGERDWQEIVNREVATTRSAVGFCDVSTLGKIDVKGPDAGELLDRLYINRFSALAVGKCRYGVMLREDGFVLDDGTVTRFGEDDFFVTTTTANAARVMQHIDFARQVLWPELDVQAVSTTEQWATYSVAGPQARAVLQKLFEGIDLSNDGFPYMTARQVRWEGMPARIFRVSFSGELAYEVSVGASRGERLARALQEAGNEFGGAPYGTEALGVMRIEKGHAAGAELNGQTTAADLGLSRMMKSGSDYIGREMSQRPGLTDPARPALVGLKPATEGARLRSGGHLFARGDQFRPARDAGHVTSSAWSPTLGHSIALGLLAHGRERHGEEIVIYDALRGETQHAVVCDPVFIDPAGERVRG